ncbi:hypothetical protein [Streptosporangium lutulentum]|uniref:Uncharacterized protein n=1 Tax=Streptosporangium lutulentum TaxID=1461250 RepID=A0ABT9Q9B5_9ACTN|nr:hypothetical protein [Streptosporangium lutulentum]MDP9843328.1 hypothetical protein [Streptosporangium lutulentum]
MLTGAVSVLADELRHTGVAHATSTEYRLTMADKLVAALDRAGYDVVERRRRKDADPAPAVPPMVLAGHPLPPGGLQVGLRVQRWTEPAPRGSGALVSKAPCCDRNVWIYPDVAPETWEFTDTNTRAVCPFCRAVYEVDLTADLDGGFWAVFTVERLSVAVVKRPGTRKATR